MRTREDKFGVAGPILVLVGVLMAIYLVTGFSWFRVSHARYRETSREILADGEIEVRWSLAGPAQRWSGFPALDHLLGPFKWALGQIQSARQEVVLVLPASHPLAGEGDELGGAYVYELSLDDPMLGD